MEAGHADSPWPDIWRRTGDDVDADGDDAVGDAADYELLRHYERDCG